VIDTDYQPDEAYFDRMAAFARTHWWYQGRRALVTQLLAGRITPGSTVIDVGCGTGDNFGMLESVAQGPVTGVELSEHAIKRAPAGPIGTRVGMALAEFLPYRTGAADVVTSMDVIEHLDDDAVALAEFHRILRPGGWLLLTVPAYQWLWSVHDETAAHRRRYSKPQLAGVVTRAGFRVETTSYFNSFLVPPAAALRRTPLRRFASENDEEVGESSALVSKVMTGLSKAERRVIGKRPMPFGLSIALLARRP
jgi:ubiquinone/menaquinone biosynthesis C-methylase UbiE